MRRLPFLVLFCFFLVPIGWAETEPNNPLEKPVFHKPIAEDVDAWKAERNCRAFLKGNALCVAAVDGQPILSRSMDEIGGLFRIRIVLKTDYASTCEIRWTTRSSPRRSDENMLSVPLNADGKDHAHELQFSVADILTSLAIRFTASDGTWEIREFQLFCARKNPVSITRIVPLSREINGTVEDGLHFTVANNSPVPVSFHVPHAESEETIEPRKEKDIWMPIQPEGCLAVVNFQLPLINYPKLIAPVFLYRPEGKANWLAAPLDNGLIVEVESDGRLARIRRGDDVVALVAPIVHREGTIPKFSAPQRNGDHSFVFEASDVNLQIDVKENSVRFRITDKAVPTPSATTVELEGPVVRVLGTMQSGLLPGVEFLDFGDASSSPIDIEPPNNDRSRPDPLWITAPLAVLATEQATGVLTWTDPRLQPTFASPNTFDGTDDHRMSLLGHGIDATVHFSLPVATPTTEPQPFLPRESAAIGAMREWIARNGIPEPPPAPRSSKEQLNLCLDAMTGPLQGAEGTSWSVAVGFPTKPYADIMSTLFRLTGRPMEPTKIVPGGSDIANDAIYFLTDRVEEWKELRETAVDARRKEQNIDGSFFFRSMFTEVESDTTSYGFTAIRSLEIMEYVRLTGKKDLFGVVEKSLNYLKYCNVPRGGFYRDTPLHTPDLFTAATLTWLFAWAHEYSGKPEYLEAAERFAWSGLPFVYLRGNERFAHAPQVPAIQLYTNISKFGATRRQAPADFGFADPNSGILYAYALNILSRSGKSADWKKIATGMLHVNEWMQYPEGHAAGCIPELFALRPQERMGKLNPALLVSLRLAIEGKVDSFAVITDGRDRIVSPFSLQIRENDIHAVGVPPEQVFQILLNGNRSINARGSGRINID